MESIDTVDKVLEIDPIVNLDYETPPEDIIRKGPVDKTSICYRCFEFYQ